MESENFQLFVDSPLSGAMNMAIDEALLTKAINDDPLTLRFYQWEVPTLSLGYFQPYKERNTHAASRNCTVVRRQSGGGAILHDRELTYSLIVPPCHPLATNAEALYFTVHRTIIQVLSETATTNQPMGKLDLWKKESSIPTAEQPFLCFGRRSYGDTVFWDSQAEHHKIVGSAQRRRRGAILQHGSILLGRSSAAPELAGFQDVAQTELDVAQFTRHLAAALPVALGVKQTAECPSNSHVSHNNLVVEGIVDKYTSKEWLTRR